MDELFDTRPLCLSCYSSGVSSSSATSYVFIHTRAGIKMPGLRTLHRLGLNVETIKPNGRPGGGHWLSATRACRLEEHQLTGPTGADHTGNGSVVEARAGNPGD